MDKLDICEFGESGRGAKKKKPSSCRWVGKLMGVEHCIINESSLCDLTRLF